jgi:hypothetical protein
MLLLQQHGNSMQNLIAAYPNSFLSPGSEFRPIQVLEPLLMHHHNWPKIKNILLMGSMWPLHPIPEVERKTKNLEFIARGNHKSAVKYAEEYTKILEKEISQGWMFILPINFVNKLQYGELAPVGIDDKVWSDLPDGSRRTKYRLTHDQSFEASVGSSVNGRVIQEKLNPLFYGGCLSRIVHYILDLRLRHPVTAILGGKSDFKAAYRRVSLHGDTAAKCSIMYEKWAIPSLRLTFGGSPCPNHFCLFSELSADIANDLLHSPNWDPSLLKSPHAEKIAPPILQDLSIEFAAAKELDICLECDDAGKVDIFIDDGMVIVPDIDNNRNRAVQSLLLAIHTLCRPLDPKEHIKRDDCLSLGKLEEEGQLSEKFTLLGWFIDTRALTIALPTEKSTRWDSDLKEILRQKKVSYASLESTLGRLNHAATACPLMRYYLSRIRLFLQHWDISMKSKRVERYLSSQVLEDLKLWRECFLPTITKGMSLNLVSYRRPSFLCWSDACPKGLGGFDHHGYAWRLKIPEKFHEAVTNKNNCLEFLASVITIWQAILHERSNEEECFLSLGDNASAIGWLHKASIDPDKNSPLFSASRKFAHILLSSKTCIYSQHIPGSSNKIADALSRKFELTDENLVSFIHVLCPNQVPPSFRIYPVHPVIDCWMTSWMQRCYETKALPKIQKKKRVECGDVGQIMQIQSDSHMIYGYQDSYLTNEPNSLALLPQPSDEDNFLAQTNNAWSRQQCKRPWQNWVRSLGQTWGTTPHMEME